MQVLQVTQQGRFRPANNELLRHKQLCLRAVACPCCLLPRTSRRVILTDSRRGQEKWGHHRSAGIPHDELS